MKIKLILGIGLIALFFTAGLVAVNSSGASAQTAETTREIGARINGKWSENGSNLASATFAPKMSNQDAVNAGIAHLVDGMGWSEELVRSLPTRTTVGLFSGIPMGTELRLVKSLLGL